MPNVEEDLEALVKQLQNANDKSVFDEILVLQKFIGQPMSDHQPISVNLFVLIIINKVKLTQPSEIINKSRT